jgi:hypothetical protein
MFSMALVEELLEGVLKFGGGEFFVHVAQAPRHFREQADHQSSRRFRVGVEEIIEIVPAGSPDLAEGLGDDRGAGFAWVEQGHFTDGFSGRDSGEENDAAILIGDHVEEAGDEKNERILIGTLFNNGVPVLDGKKFPIVAQESPIFVL